MSGAWWGRDAATAQRAPSPPRKALVPQLFPIDRAQLLADLDARAPAFTPEWVRGDPAEDAGAALRQLFGEQVEAVARRLAGWPEKAFIEFLNVAGISLLPGVPAEVLLEFEIADNASESVLVPEGFQVGARLAGADSLVIFETKDTFYAAPNKVGEIFSVSGRTFDAADTTKPFAPFGDGRVVGASMMVGFTGDNSPSQTLTLGIGVASPPDAPPPVGAGGVTSLPVPGAPTLAWEIFDGANVVPLEVVRDETGGLIRSGVVELVLPRRWRPGGPSGLPKTKSTRWLRLRLAYGRFAQSPKLSFVKLNVARALGARTVRDEIPDPVPGKAARSVRLSQTPVVPKSLVLEVANSGFELGPAAGATADETVEEGWNRWTEVADLNAWGPDDAVYVVDHTSGEITFGDGRYGRALPEGFRNVRAVSYQAFSTVPGRVDPGTLSTALTSLEFLAKVGNPVPATGGGAGETIAQVLKRGPQEIRTRGRAVTVADYALLALRAEGAQVARAYAVSGLHPQYSGRPIPGVVGVFVVPPDRGEERPTPDPESLRAVAEYLSRVAAPAGVEVVAAAPRYHDVQVDLGIVVDPAADAGATMRRVLEGVNAYLHPLTGGDANEGWPFGGAIRYVPLLQRVSRIDGVRAVKRLNVVLDGIRKPACSDVGITPYSLLWPANHQVFVLEGGSAK